MAAISLREAAEQLRARPDLWDTPTEAEFALSLARLLDGDGEGGLLAEHYDIYADIDYDQAICETCSRQEDWGSEQLPYPCPTLTLVAAYVSAVLGQEVTA
jgi:hypothetical protein